MVGYGSVAFGTEPFYILAIMNRRVNSVGWEKIMMKLIARLLWGVAVLILLLAKANYAQEQPYVILISFDGFRWDYLDRGLTPNLEKIRRQGVAAQALEPVFPSKTFPNHLSIITGMYPENHGIIFNHFRDPFSKKRYSLGNADAVQDGRWYWGEAFWQTAERQGITCASYFWPGSEIKLAYRHPTYYEHYEHKRPYSTRVQGVLAWLKLPEPERPHFITLYFDAADSYGHRYGPDAPELDSAIVNLDRQIAELTRGLAEMDLLSKTNIIIVSDHGMTEISPQKVINVEEILSGIACTFQETGPVMMVQPAAGQVEQAFARLKKNENHYRGFRREDVPDYWHFSNHPFISEIVVVADPGWSLITASRGVRGKATHGYDNHVLDMHGIFIGSGPAFKQGYRTGTVRNIDIYPLLCKIFNIMPRQNIDGRLERIGFLLRD